MTETREIALEASGLGKKYRIGKARGYRPGLRESLASVGTGLLERLRRTGDAPGGTTKATEIWALKDATFTVRRGEAVGVIGRNGAGKSTLFKVLSRITDPTEGRARIRGRVASLLEVGTGFQGDLTGRENTFLNGAILGMKRTEIAARFDEIVAFAEVERFVDTPVKHYSSGMYMRLAFAVAAHLEPEILIVDEVLAVGDAAFQEKCLSRMKDLPGGGRTVLFVSHNMSAIRQLCGRSLLFEEGRIAFDGPTEEAIELYSRRHQRSQTGEVLARRIAALAPDPVFALRELRVRQDGRETDSPSVGRPLHVSVRYELKEDVIGFTMGIDFRDPEGSVAFESFHNGAEGRIPFEKAGMYEATLEVPADFLAPTTYEIRLRPSVYGDRQCLSVPLGVSVTAQPGGRVNSSFPGYRPIGRIAPLLRWTVVDETDRIEEDAG